MSLGIVKHCSENGIWLTNCEAISTKWRKVKNMQPIWLCLFSHMLFEETSENTQWRKAKNASIQLIVRQSSTTVFTSSSISEKRKSADRKILFEMFLNSSSSHFQYFFKYDLYLIQICIFWFVTKFGNQVPKLYTKLSHLHCHIVTLPL